METRVYVNPMISFFDSNARLLLPFRHGIPVVATPLGAEGFGEGDHIRIGESADAIANHIVELYE